MPLSFTSGGIFKEVIQNNVDGHPDEAHRGGWGVSEDGWTPTCLFYFFTSRQLCFINSFVLE